MLAVGRADGSRLQPGQPGTRSPRVASAPRPWVFVAGYLVAWTAYGLVAYAVFRVAKEAAPNFLGWNRGGRYVAGAALVFAGLYELTPLKEVCLRHCRGPSISSSADGVRAKRVPCEWVSSTGSTASAAAGG